MLNEICVNMILSSTSPPCIAYCMSTKIHHEPPCTPIIIIYRKRLQSWPQSQALANKPVNHQPYKIFLIFNFHFVVHLFGQNLIIFLIKSHIVIFFFFIFIQHVVLFNNKYTFLHRNFP